LGLWLALQGYNNLPVGAFTYNHSMAFLSWVLSSKSNESYNAHLILFKSFFTQLITKKIVATNPFNGIKKLPPMNVAPLPFNRPQMEILKNKIPAQDPQLWFFVQFIYYCFIRPGELRLLKLSDINFYENKIQIRPEINKNKKMQWVSIPTQLMEQINIAGLQQYENDFFVFGRYGKPGPVPVGVNAMKLRHQAILKNLKFNINYKMYSWKHTGAVSCARAGMPLKELQLQLRHYSLDQVNHYLSSMLVFESAFVKDSFPSI
jgi:integrase